MLDCLICKIIFCLQIVQPDQLICKLLYQIIFFSQFVHQIIIPANFRCSTSNTSSSGSRQAREELKKKKIIYIQFPRWWAIFPALQKLTHIYKSVPFFAWRNFLKRYYESRQGGEKEGWLFSDWFSFSWQWGPSSVTSTGHGEEKSSPDWGKKKDEKNPSCFFKIN